jgi:hypothetical protein
VTTVINLLGCDHGNIYPLKITQGGLDGEEPHALTQNQLSHSLT